MEVKIHPTAIIDPEANIAANVEIGPYCVVGPKVEIGEGTRLLSHVNLQGPMKMGKNNLVQAFASLGTEPQDLKFNHESVRVEIGDHNTFREFTTVNRGTEGGGGLTSIKDHNLFMAYSHVAHDDMIGSHNVIANATQLAGHVTIGDWAVVGGCCAIQQFVRIGDHAYIGGASSLPKDFPPFCTGYGNRGRVTGVNVIGLKRRGFTKEQIRSAQEAQRIYFKQRLPHDQAMKRLEEISGDSELSNSFYKFIKDSKVGITPGRDSGDDF